MTCTVIYFRPGLPLVLDHEDDFANEKAANEAALDWAQAEQGKIALAVLEAAYGAYLEALIASFKRGD